MAEGKPTPNQQIVIQGIRRLEQEFAQVFNRVASTLGEDLQLIRGSMTETDRVRVGFRLNQLLDEVFGPTRPATTNGVVYNIITTVSEATVESTFKQVLIEAKSIIDAHDPTLWSKLEAKAMSGPLSGEVGWEYLVRMQNGDNVARERLLRSRLLDPQRRWVPRERWNTKTGYRLSDRIWLQRQAVRKQIDSIIRDAIKNGTDPRKVARQVEQFIMATSGTYARTSTNGTTRLYRGVIGSTKASRYSARRLAVTELQRINAQAALNAATMVPGVSGVKWLLSNSHVIIDICDDHAQQSSDGLPPGVYRVEDAPLLPAHPFCVCCWGHEFDQSTDWIDQLIIDEFGAEAA